MVVDRVVVEVGMEVEVVGEDLVVEVDLEEEGVVVVVVAAIVPGGDLDYRHLTTCNSVLFLVLLLYLARRHGQKEVLLSTKEVEI